MTADENPLGKVVAKALQDDAFKEQLIADPHATFAAEGIEVPEGRSLKVVADTETVRHLVLPAPGAVSDEELEGVDGGVGKWAIVQAARVLHGPELQEEDPFVELRCGDIGYH